MPNNCIDCDFCLLVDEDCLCTYSPLPSIPAKNIAPAILAANCQIDEITGSCVLCEGEEGKFDALFATLEFKQYYANLVYLFWQQLYGGGEASRSGMVKKASDEFSDFRVYSEREIDQTAGRTRDVVARFEKKFLTKFKELHEDCFEEESATDNCASELQPITAHAYGCGCVVCTNTKQPDNFDIGASF